MLILWFWMPCLRRWTSKPHVMFKSEYSVPWRLRLIKFTTVSSFNWRIILLSAPPRFLLLLFCLLAGLWACRMGLLALAELAWPFLPLRTGSEWCWTCEGLHPEYSCLARSPAGDTGLWRLWLRTEGKPDLLLSLLVRDTYPPRSLDDTREQNGLCRDRRGLPTTLLDNHPTICSRAFYRHEGRATLPCVISRHLKGRKTTFLCTLDSLHERASDLSRSSWYYCSTLPERQ